MACIYFNKKTHQCKNLKCIHHGTRCPYVFVPDCPVGKLEKLEDL